jgi:predicted MFS family arabinose efflux permease
MGFPDNFLTMFAAAAPFMLLGAISVIVFTVPKQASEASEARDVERQIVGGLRQFVENRAVLFGIALYILVYCGHEILNTVSLHAKETMGQQSDTLGLQQFLRFGFKSAAGALLGWLLAKASARATLLATTAIMLVGIVWAVYFTGPMFMISFGILGAGELFGAYFPNYVTSASAKRYVRVNVAYMSVLGATTGFAAVVYGWISDAFGRFASFYTAIGVLVLSLGLICLLLPPNPDPKESPTPD